MSQIAGSIDPITATLNQFNPVVMLATAVQNVRVASEVYGTGSGYMVEAQLLGAVKGALPAIGAVVGSVIPGLGTAVGAAIGSAIASTIHIDTTTGKRSYQTTDATGVGLVVSAATWGAGAYLTGAMQTVAQYSLTAASGGMKYDENGKVTGGFDPVAAGISMAAKAAGQYGGDLFGEGQTGSFLASDITSTVLNVGIQYHNYSQGYQNNYAAVAGADLSRLGSFAGGIAGAMYGDSRTAEANAIVKNGTSDGMTREQIEAAMRRAGLYEEADGYKNQVEKLNLAREAQRNEQNELALQILQGLGYRREEIDQIMQENLNSIAIQDFLESISDDNANASALRLRAAAYRDGRAVSTKTMAEGEVLLTELNAKVNGITGGTRGLTNAELLLLAAEYNIDSSYLFDSQTEATMQYFSTKNFSADYQAQLMIENALQQAMNNGPLPTSMGNGGSWLSLFSPLYAESSKDPNVVLAFNRLQRDEFNKREYFYMDGVKYVRVGTGAKAYFEATVNGNRLTYTLTENGVVRHEYIGRNDDRKLNPPFAPDGEMWSSVQEWWNNNKQGIQQSIKLYGESLATSGAFALFMQSKEQKNSGNTDDTSSNNSETVIATLNYTGRGHDGTVSIVRSNIET